MEITDEGLNQIERYADKKKDPQTMLICQCLREIRELKALIKEQDDNARNSGN